MVAINNREITIIRRYFLKADYAPKGLHKGDVVLIVRNDQGKEYEVILRRNKAHSCSCPAGQHSHKCYHVSTLAQVENARIEARLAARAAKVVEMPAQEVRLPEAYRGSHKTMTVKGDPIERETAPLNGNKGFSVLKIA